MEGGPNRRNPPQFADPFAGFGFGRSMISDFFGRDPFDDPFFTRPFGSMLERPFGPGFDNGLPFSSHPGLLGGANRNASQSGPVITEVEEDAAESIGRGASQRSHAVPLVEHPDDDDEPVTRRSQNDERAGWRDITVTDGSGRNSNNSRGGQVQTYRYSTSSVYQSGINGQHTYSSTTARRTGPGGVLEEQHVESDSRNGETVRHSRGIGDKGRTVIRKKTHHGKEDVRETLHNMTPDEAQRFERTWQDEAERALPQYGFAPSGGLQQGERGGQHALPQSSARPRGLPGGRYA